VIPLDPRSRVAPDDPADEDVGDHKGRFGDKEHVMASSRTSIWRRAAGQLGVPALAVAVVAIGPFAAPRQTAQPRWTPMTPVSVTYNDAGTDLPDPAGADPAGRRRTAKGHLIAFNDFHGNIDPPTGSSGTVNGTPAGGVEYLATWVKRQRAAALAETPNVFTVGAGDLVGASPLVSAAFHDEPAIEEMNSLGMQASSVGNHEFDEGVTELKRLQSGGCHPTDGCADGDGYAGAEFPYLAANVTDRQSGLPVLLPLSVRFVDGVPVAFVGMTLQGTGSIVNPAGVATVDFQGEVATANRYAELLSWFGIHSLVLLIHQGGSQQVAPPALPDISSCANFAGDITGIVSGLRPEYGVVVSGHTHQFYSCALPNSSGQNSVVTSASSFGRMLTDISFSVDTHSRRFTGISARNVIVENGVRNADGTWAKDAQGNFIRSPDLVDPAAKAIADKYRTAVAPVANRVVGSITDDIVNTPVASGESPLGDVIADAMLAYTGAAKSQIGLMNPGGIRTSLVYADSRGGERPGQVTYGECFTVQPFNNLVVTLSYTGAQLKTVLEQQWQGQTTPKVLQVSAGFSYTYDLSRPLGDRVSNMALGGVPIDPATTYRVGTNDFLANGGDGFTALRAGVERATAPGFDIDALTAYLQAHAPVPPGPTNRITRVG
jgi:5'-nucleotidase